MLDKAEARALGEYLQELGHKLLVDVTFPTEEDAVIERTVENLSYEVQAVGLAMRGEESVEGALNAKGRLKLPQYKALYEGRA